MMQDNYPLVENKMIARNIYRMSFIADSLASEPEPGQFFQLRVSEGYDPLLRRPISICDYDSESKLVTLVYRSSGRGTELLSKKKFGDPIDVFGPLGRGFPYQDIGPNKRILLVGGGIGLPPLYYLGRKLKENGMQLTTVIGCLSQVDRILYDEFKELGDVRLATVDGSCGMQGTVLDALSADDNWDRFYSCGPTGMLRTLQKLWMDKNIEGFMSLEERMACGIGACYGCIIKVDREKYPGGYQKVCSDGPVFSFREVIL